MPGCTALGYELPQVWEEDPVIGPFNAGLVWIYEGAMAWRVEFKDRAHSSCVRVSVDGAGYRVLSENVRWIYATRAEAFRVAEEQLLAQDAERRLRVSRPDTNIPDVGE